MIAASIASLHATVQELHSAALSDDTQVALRKMVELHTSMVSTFQNLAVLTTTIEASLQQTARHHNGRKPLSESKCISNLKVLGSDKSEFKNWNEKLINAISQSFGVSWRAFMKNLNCRLDQDRKVLSPEQL